MLWIALFRGINVGGKNTLPMKDLVLLLENLGCVGVQTYIQSGNAVFDYSEGVRDRISETIRSAVFNDRGFRPEVLVMTPGHFRRVVAANPFPAAVDDPSKLHVYFMKTVPENPDTDLLARLKSPSEDFEVVGDTAYLHAPDGVGRSKLAAGVERVLGVSGTGRNWRTVGKILEIVESR
jgi:uncharacterized protein (DUF1697 family)